MGAEGIEMTDEEKAEVAEWVKDVPPHPPKYSRGQVVVALVYKKQADGKLYFPRREAVCEVVYHLTCGTGFSSFDGVRTTTPPHYAYGLRDVDDGQEYHADEADIGRFVPPGDAGWEPEESK